MIAAICMTNALSIRKGMLAVLNGTPTSQILLPSLWIFLSIRSGVPDVGLSSEIDRLHDLVASKTEMGRERFSLSVEATGAAPQSNSGGGILAKLFGGGNPALPEKKPIEIPAKAISVESDFDIQDVEEVKPEPVKVPRQRKK